MAGALPGWEKRETGNLDGTRIDANGRARDGGLPAAGFGFEGFIRAGGTGYFLAAWVRLKETL